ncbi:MAG: hypothetical protein HZB29_01885 [Nitrospinae bacterium]|nr:hypothetical protein [Nitrospinota bacterium]
MEPDGGEKQALEKIGQLEESIRERLAAARVKARQTLDEAERSAAVLVRGKEAELEKLDRQYAELIATRLAPGEKPATKVKKIRPPAAQAIAGEIFSLLVKGEVE